MKIYLQMASVVFVGLALAIGCNNAAEPTTGDSSNDSAAVNGSEEHAHTHEGDDALIWQRADLDHEGYVISLGHHGKQLFADHHAEPAVMVTKDGLPVADAKVFVTLLDAAGDAVLTAEQATVFEPTTAEEPAHYAQASVKLPKDATEVTLRYRIELPEAPEFTQDVVVQASKH